MRPSEDHGGEAGRMSGERKPAVVVRFELEAAPLVLADWDDANDQRMTDWLDAHPDYWYVIAQEVILAEQERTK
jgi:hypothetical protein